MIGEQDRRIAWLERELGILREVSTEALHAYRGIGMGANGWKARDRVAFADLEEVLRRPTEEIVADEDRHAFARQATELLLATQGKSGIVLNGPLWEGIVIVAELASPGLRQAVRRTGQGVPELLPDEREPAFLAAAAIVHADETHGFPTVDILTGLVGIARAAA